MILSTVFRGIVPGIGQIQSGRAGKGLLFFSLFVFFLNGWLVVPLLADDEVVRNTLLSLSILLWLISLVDLLSISTEEEIQAQQNRHDGSA